MSDENRPEDEVEAHGAAVGPQSVGPMASDDQADEVEAHGATVGPQSVGPMASDDQDSDVEAHGALWSEVKPEVKPE